MIIFQLEMGFLQYGVVDVMIMKLMLENLLVNFIWLLNKKDMDIKKSRKRIYKTIGIILVAMFVCLLLLWVLIKPYVLKAVDRADELTKPVAAEEVTYKDGSKVFTGEVSKTIFDGHEYIIFEKYWNTSFSMSPLHSPECPCMKQINN